MKIFATNNFGDSTFNGEPIISIHPDTTTIRDNEPFYIPNLNSQISANIGIILKFGKMGKSVSEKFVDKYVSQIGIGIKFYAKDLFLQLLKENRRPDMAMDFDNSFAISEFTEIVNSDVNNLPIYLKYNNRQDVINTKDGFFSVSKLISSASKLATFKIGDLYFISYKQVDKIQEGDVFDFNLSDTLNLHCEVK